MFAFHEERGTGQSLQLILVVFSSGFEGYVRGVTIVAEMGSRYRPTSRNIHITMTNLTTTSSNQNQDRALDMALFPKKTGRPLGGKLMTLGSTYSVGTTGSFS